MRKHLGYEIRGARPILGGLDHEAAMARIRSVEKGDWTDLPLDEIAIEWHHTSHVGEVEAMIEGITVKVLVGGGIAPPDHHVLSDLVEVVEGRDRVRRQEKAGMEGRSAHNTQVDLAAEFIDRHGPLWLCDKHGLPVGHVPDCNECWDRDRVSHIVSLAEQCWAALKAAETLRGGRPIESEHHELLKLPDSPPPPIPSLFMSKEDRIRVRARLADPIVDDWRRLEAWLDTLGEWSKGVFPAVVDQLAAACRRDAARRVCKNPECDRDFVPDEPNHRYCGDTECRKSRTRQRQAKLATCPNCGRKISAKVEKCPSCRGSTRPTQQRSHPA